MVFDFLSVAMISVLLYMPPGKLMTLSMMKTVRFSYHVDDLLKCQPKGEVHRVLLVHHLQDCCC